MYMYLVKGHVPSVDFAKSNTSKMNFGEGNTFKYFICTGMFKEQTHFLSPVVALTVKCARDYHQSVITK